MSEEQVRAIIGNTYRVIERGDGVHIEDLWYGKAQSIRDQLGEGIIKPCGAFQWQVVVGLI